MSAPKPIGRRWPVYTHRYTLRRTASPRGVTSMTTEQVEFSERELLADADITEPLIAGGVRCHGGFDDEGRYVSPRTKHRVPGIVAWQEKHTEEFGKPILDI